MVEKIKVTVSISSALVKEVKALAKANAQTFSGIVEMQLTRFVENAKKQTR